MQSNIQIEDLFKTHLSGTEVTPSGNIWEGVNSQLSDKEMSAFFQSKFANSSVQPSASTWNGIASQLPKVGFWQSSTATVLYSVSGIAALIIGILFFASPFTSPKHDTLANKKNTSTTIVETQNNINSETTSLNSNDDAINSDNTDFTNSSGTSNGTNYTDNNIQPKPTDTNNSGDCIALGKDNDQKKDTKEGNQKKESKNQVSSDKPSKTLITLNENPSEGLKFIDTLIVYDTIKYYDTLIVENKKPIKAAITTSLWSITPHVNTFGSNPNHNGGSDELKSLFNKSYSNDISYSFGISANYDYKNWRVSSGLDYTVIQEEFNYETQTSGTNIVKKYTLEENGFYSDIHENISYTYEYREGFTYDTIHTDYTVIKYEYENYTVLDTVWRYKIDSVFISNMDTIAHIKYDTVRVATYDTSYYSSVDTNIYTTYYQNINKYTYIEIPLSIGYAFNIKKFAIRPTVGALFGIMLNAKGNGISTTNKNEVYSLSEMDLPFMNIQVSMFVGIGFEYKIQENLALSFQPFYRRNLSSIYSEESVLDKRFSGLGASFGLSFYLN